MSTSSRTIAVEVLHRVFFDGAFSHIALSHALDDSKLSPRDQGLTTELVYGTLARKRTIDAVLSRFVNRSIDTLDRPVLLALRLAAYQLIYLDRVPAHAAVDESVEIAKEHCGRGAAGFTNGVLRSMLRKKRRWNPWDDVDAQKDPVRHLGLRYSLPDWISAMLIEQHGTDNARRVARALGARPPLYFRALQAVPEPLPDGLSEVDAVDGALRAEQMSAAIRQHVDDGRLVVQDLGSQLVGHFAEPSEATEILDACAGLGGKTLHLAALAGDNAQITAVDPMGSKLDRLSATIADTALEDRITTLTSTLADLSKENSAFDLVLVDAPCSGIGVIRRHPETRWRRGPKDVENRARLQAKLLRQAAHHVSPGGLLVYAVCSFSDAEGRQQIEAFLEEQDHFQREPLSEDDEIDWSRYTDEAGDLRLNPADHDTDAFYAARLRCRE